MQPPTTRSVNAVSTQLPLSSGYIDGFAVRSIGSMVAQGGNNPTMPMWRQPAPGDRDNGVVGPGNWDGVVGHYFGSDSVAPDSSQWYGTDGNGYRLNPANLIDDIQLPSEIVTATPGFMTNERVNYQYPVNKDWLLYSRILERQMYAFMRTSATNPTVVRQGLPYRSNAWEGFYTVTNLATLNYAEACAAEIGKPDRTPRQVLSEWTPIGAIVTTKGMEFSEQPQNAAVVVGLRGPARLFNVWGNNLEAGTPLYFIVKPIDTLPDYYILDPEGQHFTAPASTGRGTKKRAVQFIPYASLTHPVPPKHLLAYYDEEGMRRYGSTVLIGRVSHRTVAVDPTKVATAWFSTKSIISLENFEVLLQNPIIQHYS